MTSDAVDLGVLAPGLSRDADGIWRAVSHTRIDYPDEANAFCFAIEESSFWFNHRNRVIVDAVQRFRPSGPIADVGAGNGYVALALERAGFSTIVIEPGAAGARNARARGMATVVCTTLEEAGFRPGSLAAAGLFDVLEHIADDRAFLRGVRDRLSATGRLYATVPALPSLWSSEDDLVGHHRRYTIGSLSALCASTGFRVEFASYFFWPLPLPLFLLRSVPSRLGMRSTLDPAKTATELRPSPAIDRAMMRLLRWEERRLQRGKTMPIGTSCLVVATAA
jgi:SAM-dependent methyltransferase